MVPIRHCKGLAIWKNKLELIPSNVHLVFHVSCLKKVINDTILVETIFPIVDEEGKIILDLEIITKTLIEQLRT